VVPFRDFGARVIRDFSVPVILVAILLDIALTGAFVNARRAEDGPTQEEAA
jgi:NADH:ubiquinone oxidoreductase subunit 6 (subunit J)